MFLTSLLVSALLASGQALAVPRAKPDTVATTTSSSRTVKQIVESIQNKPFTGLGGNFPAMTLQRVAEKDVDASITKKNIRGGVTAEAKKGRDGSYENQATLTFYGDNKCEEMVYSEGIVANTCVEAVNPDEDRRVYSYYFDIATLQESYFVGSKCRGKVLGTNDVGDMFGVSGKNTCAKFGDYWIDFRITKSDMREAVGGFMVGNYAAPRGSDDDTCADSDLLSFNYFHNGACNDLFGPALTFRTNKCEANGGATVIIRDVCGGSTLMTDVVPEISCQSGKLYDDDDDAYDDGDDDKFAVTDDVFITYANREVRCM